MKTYTRFWWLAGLLTLCLCLAFTACNGGDTEADTTAAPPDTAAPTEPVTDAPAADTTTETLTEPAKGGCGSAVTFGLAAILVAAAVCVIRKKD